MRLVFVSTIGYPMHHPDGGVPTYVREIAQALSQRGHDVSVLTKGYEKGLDFEKDGQVSVYYLRLGNIHYYLDRISFRKAEARFKLVTPIRDIETSLYIRRFIERLNSQMPIDVVEYPDVWVEGLFHPYHTTNAIAAIRLHTPMCIVRKIPGLRMVLGLRIHDYLQTRAIAKAQVVASPNQAVAKSFIEEQLNRPVVVIPYCVNIDTFSPEKRNVPDAGQPLRIFHPNPRPDDWQKGSRYLIDAMPQIIQEYPQVEFRFVGRSAIRKVFKIPENAKIVELGWLSKEQMAIEYANADVCVITSQHYETGPYTVIEAAACGAAICASNIVGPSEVLDNGNVGLLFEAGDSQSLATAILKLLRDSTMRKMLGEKARRRSETVYASEVVAAHLERIYLEAIEWRKLS